VESGSQRHQTVLLKLVQLVERQEKAGTRLSCGLTDLSKQLNRVFLEFATVGDAGRRPCLDAEPDASVRIDIV